MEEGTLHRVWQYSDWSEDGDTRNELFAGILRRASTERVNREVDVASEESVVSEMATVALRLGDYPLWKVKTRVCLSSFLFFFFLSFFSVLPGRFFFLSFYLSFQFAFSFCPFSLFSYAENFTNR